VSFLENTFQQQMLCLSYYEHFLAISATDAIRQFPDFHEFGLLKILEISEYDIMIN